MPNSISFGARLVKSTQVQKLSPKNKSYIPKNVAVVEIDPYNSSDISALSDAARSWVYEKYASNIVYTANSLFSKDLDEKYHKVLAVTEQLENLKFLDSKKILGMADIKIKDPKSIELNYIQVDPEISYYIGNQSSYKKIGTKILDVLKSMYDRIELTVAKGSVKNFYLKNGFKCLDKGKYVWQKIL